MANTKKPPMTEAEKAAKKAEREKAKADNFIRLADARVTKALDAMAALRGLANRNTYTYDMAQVKAIFGALEGEMTTLQGLFAPGAAAQEAKGFSLAAAVAKVEPAVEETATVEVTGE